MAALLATLAVMMVVMTAALPVLSTIAQRERETELVFRGQQYARAITLFQRKYGNALPPNLDVLLNEKFLRTKYKDPITGDDFQLLGPGSPELAAALNAAPVTGQPGQQQPGNTRPAQQAPGMTPPTAVSQFQNRTQSGQPSGGGGIMAVASKSTRTSLRVYNGHDKYNEWVFMPTQASIAAGGGARGGGAGGAGGAAGRGGRGNVPPGGRGDSRGRFGSPQPPFGGERGTGPAPQGPPRGFPPGGRP
jgi:type II secretory pathway pseudopilin PulG